MKSILPLLKNSAFILLAGIFLSCTHRAYLAPNFQEVTASHQLVAVLPAEMIFTGTRPQNMTEEDVAKTELLESKVFQQYQYNNILAYAQKGKKKMHVNFQSVDRTNELLEKRGISLRESWKMNASDLCDILGVDAVVRLQVKKQRYMSDLASLGISIGQTILNRTGNPVVSNLPVSNRTGSIYATCTLQSDDVVLWNDVYDQGTDFYYKNHAVIADITRKFGKRFPYKRRK